MQTSRPQIQKRGKKHLKQSKNRRSFEHYFSNGTFFKTLTVPVSQIQLILDKHDVEKPVFSV
jgi:hypothetical protein